MGTKTAQNIIDIAEEALQDQTNTLWREATHLKAFNDGQRQIVILKPDANIVSSAVKLIAGTKQSLPSKGIFLFDIIRNMGTGGTTPGNTVTLVDMSIMNAVLPTWHGAVAAATAIHFMYDPKKDPKTFWIYPPQPTSSQGYVEEQYAELPSDIAIGDAITLDDAYSDALVAYVLFRAWEKKKPETSVGYWNLFLNLLGLKDTREEQEDPNIKTVKGGLP